MMDTMCIRQGYLVTTFTLFTVYCRTERQTGSDNMIVTKAEGAGIHASVHEGT